MATAHCARADERAAFPAFQAVAGTRGLDRVDSEFLSQVFGQGRPRASAALLSNVGQCELVSCPRSSLAKSADLVQDDVGRRSPDEGRAVLVVVRQIVVNGRLKGRHTLEGAAANPSSRDRREEAFDLIEPARARRCEMQVIARMAYKPPKHLWRLMGPVVVHDHVHVPVRRQLRIDALEKFQQLLMAMTTVTLPDPFPVATSKAANREVVPWRM